MKVIGLRIEKYIGQEVSGHNCSFEYSDCEKERHIILAILEDGSKVEITLYQEEGECYSGWTTASWGMFDMKKVENFSGYTHKCLYAENVDDLIEKVESYSCPLFNFSYDGGDSYYPSGYYDVDMEFFKENGRAKELRPTYIFKGNSGIGKSFLANKISQSGSIVFETDSVDSLPQNIMADVVVLGNKRDFSMQEISKRIFNSEIIIVSFEKYQ